MDSEIKIKSSSNSATVRIVNFLFLKEYCSLTRFSKPEYEFYIPNSHTIVEFELILGYEGASTIKCAFNFPSTTNHHTKTSMVGIDIGL